MLCLLPYTSVKGISFKLPQDTKSSTIINHRKPSKSISAELSFFEAVNVNDADEAEGLHSWRRRVTT